ncbi:hypothetical protein AVEN_23891-1 [Araneus ventricosus]|uniref:Uncharacterized protein n=1 Tax=Araneus ventricosus TaxID=182803 RepID=A0A4Y2FIX2_ARAVE|nr:hypothetical protein AVEN_23891-1 [Araneus ventricosus]
MPLKPQIQKTRSVLHGNNRVGERPLAMASGELNTRPNQRVCSPLSFLVYFPKRCYFPSPRVNKKMEPTVTQEAMTIHELPSAHAKVTSIDKLQNGIVS